MKFGQRLGQKQIQKHKKTSAVWRLGVRHGLPRVPALHVLRYFSYATKQLLTKRLALNALSSFHHRTYHDTPTSLPQLSWAGLPSGPVL
jgi:hypothetical protein